MEKRSRRRIRDLVALAAFQGLSQNEIGCARISMMARSTKAPFKGRIQKRKTNHLQIITFGLQRTAGPYKGANRDLIAANVTSRDVSHSLTLPNASERYTLHASRLQSETVQLNRGTLALDVNDALLSITAAPTPAGVVTFAPATITFLAIPAAANRACR
jgi:hypothetical protein